MRSAHNCSEGGRICCYNSSQLLSVLLIALNRILKLVRPRMVLMPETRNEREKYLWTISATDCIQLIRIYQNAIGTPNGQIPIPGIASGRMIDVILMKEFPAPVVE